jgi:hypothetical protein
MRTLCFFLILANVLYFVWSQLIDVQVSALDRPPARTAEAPPRIVLAREVSEPEPLEEPEVVRDVQPPRVAPLRLPTEGTARSSGGGGLTCTSVGPFAALPEASQAQAALRGAGFDPRQRVEEGEIWVGYWVSVQNLATRAVADSSIQVLKDAGIDDVYLMPGGDPSYTLSLGVFTDHQRARRRADEVRAVGLEPQIEDRTRAGSVYWLDVNLPEAGRTIDTAIFQSDPGKIMRLEMKGCPQERSG